MGYFDEDKKESGVFTKIVKENQEEVILAEESIK
jgi:hypothetical protein